MIQSKRNRASHGYTGRFEPGFGPIQRQDKLGIGIGSNAGKPRVASESESVVVPTASFCAHFDPRASSGPRVCMGPLAAWAHCGRFPVYGPGFAPVPNYPTRAAAAGVCCGPGVSPAAAFLDAVST